MSATVEGLQRMDDDADTLRQELAELRARLERNERLLDKTIGALAVTSGATEALWTVMNRHYSTKSDGDAYAAGITLRGVFSVMKSALHHLRQVVEKSAHG